jgi:dTDP-4-amino-4,6-dideoxygalactose transaminase
MGDQEQKYVKDAFDSNWIAPLGPHVNAFEHELEEITGSPHILALSSGTAALHLALIIAGVEEGDEVICQSITFSATANPIVYQQANPVFIGSEPATWNMDPNALEDAIKDRLRIKKRIKAILPVHLYGMPAMTDELMSVANKYEIPVIEDAAEALGASYKGRHPGTDGVMGILSFNGNKIITTSGGGALMCHDQTLKEKAYFFSTQARDKAPHYQHSHIGYNYRMSNVLAAIGRGQLKVLEERVKARRANFQWYQLFFKDFEGITLQNESEGFRSTRWLTTIQVDPAKTGGITREDIRLALDAENIEARPLWKSMHTQPVFAGYPYYGNRLEETLFENGLCMPSGSNLTPEDFERIGSVLQKVLGT